MRCEVSAGKVERALPIRQTSFSAAGLQAVFYLLLLFLIKPNLLALEPDRSLESKIAEARKAKNRFQLTTLLIKQGEVHGSAGDFAAALMAYREAYQLASERRNIDDQIFTAAQLANTYDQMGKLNEALQWYKTAQSTALKSGETSNLPNIHVNLGNLYLKIGSFSQSLQHYQQALEIKRKNRDDPGLANVLLNLSIYYLKTGNYEKTLDYQLQALELRRKIGDKSLIAATLSSISITYRHLENFPKAFEYNQKALQLAKELDNPAKIASYYNNLGVLYYSSGDLPRAQEAYLKSYELKKNSRAYQSVLSPLHNLADISIKLNRLSEAKLYLDKANALLAGTQLYELNRSIAKANADYYEKTGDYRRALDFYKRFWTISDSLSNVEKMSQLSELEVKYEVREKEKHIELLTKNNELTRKDLEKSTQLKNSLMLIIALILLSAVIFIWRYLSILKLNRSVLASREELNRLNQELEKRVETEVENRRMQEQKALRQSRLALLGELAAGIAHELNQPMQTLSLTLENIMLAIADDKIDDEYLKRKMKYLFQDIGRMQAVIEHIRCFSRSSEETETGSFQIAASIQNACNMVRERFEQQGISFKISVAENLPEINGNQYKFEHVILNLLTNSRDAILENLQQGRITIGLIEILAHTEADKVVISVRDNGCGIQPEVQDKVFDIFFSTKSLEQGTGLGLAISAGIVQGMHASLSLESNPPEGTVVRIAIPRPVKWES